MHINQFKFNSRLLVILSFSFLLHPILNGQQIEKVDRNKYKYEGQIYKYSEMDHIFRQDKFSYVEFHKAIQKGKTAKSSGIMALISLGVTIGTSAFIFDNDKNPFEDDFTTEGIVIGVTGIICVGSALGALGAHAGSLKWKRKSVETFNQYASDIENESSLSVNAQLGLLSNGRVGLVFNF